MNSRLRYLLVSDGSSDRCLLYIIDWLLREIIPQVEVASQWANPLEYEPTSMQICDKLTAAIRFYECDLIFVHRDAEKEPAQNRVDEIDEALSKIDVGMPVAMVVPVKMMEAWLLADEHAIRKAANNPNGLEPLAIPPVRALEKIPDPKETIFSLLRDACGLPTQRRKRFNVRQRVERIAELTNTFAPLRTLDAFKRFEQSTKMALRDLGLVEEC